MHFLDSNDSLTLRCDIHALVKVFVDGRSDRLYGDGCLFALYLLYQVGLKDRFSFQYIFSRAKTQQSSCVALAECDLTRGRSVISVVFCEAIKPGGSVIPEPVTDAKIAFQKAGPGSCFS